MQNWFHEKKIKKLLDRGEFLIYFRNEIDYKTYLFHDALNLSALLSMPGKERWGIEIEEGHDIRYCQSYGIVGGYGFACAER